LGGFGTPAAKPPETKDELLRQLLAIQGAYTPNSTSYRFQALFYRAAPAKSAMGTISVGSKKPDCMTEQDWQQAVDSAPIPIFPSDDVMVPEVLQGFAALQTRHGQQEETIEQMKKKLTSLRTRIATMATAFSQNLAEDLRRLEQTNATIEIEMVEQFRAKQERADKELISSEEAELFERLSNLERGLDRPKQFIAALNALRLNGDDFQDTWAQPAAPIVTGDAKAKVQQILAMNSDALKALRRAAKQAHHRADRILAVLTKPDRLV
jgi:vacuolar-type H+-ATPase subunit I/STV1